MCIMLGCIMAYLSESLVNNATVHPYNIFADVDYQRPREEMLPNHSNYAVCFRDNILVLPCFAGVLTPC